MPDYKKTLTDMREMWEAYELHGLDMEGNPFRCEQSVKPTAAIVMVLNGHAALRFCIEENERLREGRNRRMQRLEGLVRGFRSVGEPLFAAYLKTVTILTPTALHLIRGARMVLDQAAAFKPGGGHRVDPA